MLSDPVYSKYAFKGTLIEQFVLLTIEMDMMKRPHTCPLFAPLFFVSAIGLNACSSDSAAPPLPPAPTTLTLSSFQNASVVIGQTNFGGATANQGGAAGANTISSTYGNVAHHNGVLYISDYDNNRILGFNSVPAVNNQVADFVLGQPDFTTTTPGVTSTIFSGPQTVAIDDGKMFAASFNNHRVLIWNTVPASGGVAPDVVVGQADFTSNATGCTSTNLNEPQTLWAADGKLIVTDFANHRVLIWNSIPTINNQPADIVLGQQSFSNCAANDLNDDGTPDTPSASTLRNPGGVWSDGTRLVVLDSSNNRVLIWNSFPTTNFTPADLVLGQSDFVHVTANDDDQNIVVDAPGNVSTARTMRFPFAGVYSNGEQLFIADNGNNRLLVWNTFPTSSFAPADVVLGQGDFVHTAQNDDNQDNVADASPTARTLGGPTGVNHVGTQLIVSDLNNNRVLIYDSQ